MKVLDLGCEQGHGFEGWFASEEDFSDQRERGLLECPLCGTRAVHKRLSAPRLNLGRGASERPMGRQTESVSGDSARADAANAVAGTGTDGGSPEAAATLAVMQEAWLKAVRHVMAHTEDVGGRFAEEARRIHYGESHERAIRGQVSGEERQSLLEEGIEVMALPVPKGLTGPVQ